MEAPVAISQEKEFEFFNRVTDLAYRLVAHPIYGDYVEYDPEVHPAIVARLSENLIREIKGNFLKYRALNQHICYFKQCKTDLANLLMDYPYKDGEFYRDLDFYRDQIVGEIEKLESDKALYATTGDSQDIKPLTKPLTKAIVALKYAIEEKTITRGNADQIAKDFNLGKGEDLYQAFTQCVKTIDRRGDPGSKSSLAAKIGRYERAIEILSEEFKSKADDELKSLRIALGKY